jgi:glycosyltransferase involved in cell wall biosynthesis
MPSSPKVSVILTSFNHGKYLREAIDSVLSQTFTDFELIIWDDASTDNSWEIILSYRDARIKAFRNEVNERYTVNSALKSGKVLGEYVAIHHSDDIWEPEKLDKQVAFLGAHPAIGAVFSWVEIIDESGQSLQDTNYISNKVFEQANRSRFEWLNHFFYRGNALCHPSVLIRKQCYDDVGLYRTGLNQLADFNMWIRLCMRYDIHVLPERLIRLRVVKQNANISGNRQDVRIRTWFEYLQALENYREIINPDDLIRLFPLLDKYIHTDGFVASFVLAMAALEYSESYNITKYFGLKLLFEVMSNPESQKRVEEIYGFKYKDFFELTGKHDVFSIELVSQLRENIAKKDALLADKDALLAEKDAFIWEILNSKGWKFITAIRTVKSKFQR